MVLVISVGLLMVMAFRTMCVTLLLSYVLTAVWLWTFLFSRIGTAMVVRTVRIVGVPIGWLVKVLPRLIRRSYRVLVLRKVCVRVVGLALNIAVVLTLLCSSWM